MVSTFVIQVQQLFVKLRYFFHFANRTTNLPRVRGELNIPIIFFHGHFGIKTPLILYNADKRSAKYTLISEYADKTVRAVSANYWRKSPKTHPNWNDHEYHSVICSGHTGVTLWLTFLVCALTAALLDGFRSYFVWRCILVKSTRLFFFVMLPPAFRLL